MGNDHEVSSEPSYTSCRVTGGAQRARLLLEVFVSVVEVLPPNEAALRSVEGIGSTTVEHICWAIRESGVVYGHVAQYAAGLEVALHSTIMHNRRKAIDGKRT